jgi:hypothetical protein
VEQHTEAGTVHRLGHLIEGLAAAVGIGGVHIERDILTPRCFDACLGALEGIVVGGPPQVYPTDIEASLLGQRGGSRRPKS